MVGIGDDMAVLAFPSDQLLISPDMIMDGKYDMRDVIQPIYDAINEQYGLDEKQE